MPGGELTKKEDTILARSEALNEMLDGLRARLDKRFARTTQPEASEKAQAQQPDNVLDEILGNQAEGQVKLTTITSILSSEVLPKIN